MRRILVVHVVRPVALHRLPVPDPQRRPTILPQMWDRDPTPKTRGTAHTMNFISFADDDEREVLINPAHIVGLEARDNKTVVYLLGSGEIVANLDVNTILGLLKDV
jgi:hypothetical protein